MSWRRDKHRRRWRLPPGRSCSSSDGCRTAPSGVPSPPTCRCWRLHCRDRGRRASISPLDWICPLLGIDADAFNHGGTPEFAAISAVVQRHNEISNVLSTAPRRFAPLHSRKPNGDVDAAPWCQGFHAALQPRLKAWAPAARIEQHQPWPASAHPVAPCRRSGPAAAWTGEERA